MGKGFICAFLKQTMRQEDVSMPFGFPFHTAQELYDSVKGPYALPPQGDVALLTRPVQGRGFRLKNAMVVQPMEGCDGTTGGAPTDWTVRRYRRFAAGGAGLLWMEAVSVDPDARANPCQLMITEDNADDFRRLLEAARKAADEAGVERPKIIAQLTHSGRWSRPYDEKRPIRNWTNPVLDPHQNLPADYPVITDGELEALPDKFARTARLCMQAGFDGVDVKACHLYLMSEMLGGFDRPGPYGGSYENRTAIYFACVDAARAETGDGILAARINLYDGEAGRWGVGGNLSLDLSEPLRLARDLEKRGVVLLNITMGTPYYNPHVNRPYARGGYEQPENPVDGVARLLYGCAQAQSAVPDVVCVATGMSYLRQFGPAVAAGLLAQGGARCVGWGRGSFAYPDFAKDIIERGAMAPEKCCVTCGVCTKIMRQPTGRPGCPVRDTAWYQPEYQRVLGGKK